MTASEAGRAGAGESPKPMLTNEEACELLQCSKTTLHHLLATGQLPGMKISRNWVIPREAFIAGINALAEEKATERRTALTPPPQPFADHGHQELARPRRRGPRSAYDKLLDEEVKRMSTPPAPAEFNFNKPGRRKAPPTVDWGAAAQRGGGGIKPTSPRPPRGGPALPLRGMTDEEMAATERMFAGLPPLVKRAS